MAQRLDLSQDCCRQSDIVTSVYNSGIKKCRECHKCVNVVTRRCATENVVFKHQHADRRTDYGFRGFSLPLLANCGTIKANSHMPCRAHAVHLPCRAALIHTCHAAPLPFSDSAVSLVKVRVVTGNTRTASPTV
jgi:hypothetical protein